MCVYLLHTNWLSVRLLTLVPLSDGGALQEPAITVVNDERELRKLGNQRSSQSQRRGFLSKLLWKQGYVYVVEVFVLHYHWMFSAVSLYSVLLMCARDIKCRKNVQFLNESKLRKGIIGNGANDVVVKESAK